MCKKFRKLLLLVVFLVSQVQCRRGSVGKYGKIRNLYARVDDGEMPEQNPNSKLIDYKNHSCKRECYANQTMICYFYFIVHYDETFGPSCVKYMQNKYRFNVAGREYIDIVAIIKDNKEFDDCKYIDGIGKELLLVNGHFPGLSMEVCAGDTIVVDVINSLLETTTMHWHGILQHASPHMDGVPHVTQYPIEPGQAFRYRFVADHAGTNWWHSHTEHQRAYGLAGALIVRQPKAESLHTHLYDFDRSEDVIIIQDYTHDFYYSVPSQLLINGRGRRNLPATSAESNQRPTLYARFSVVRGGRYRFRIISNGVTNCPLTLSIDQHDLVVIASDGYDIEPVTVQKLTLHGGERFDFVLNANQPVNNYWMRLKGYAFCAQTEMHQEAILSYVGANVRSIPTAALSYAYEPAGIELNPVALSPTKDRLRLSLADLTALPKEKTSNNNNRFWTYYTQMYLNTTEDLIFQMDRISFSMEHVSLLQTRNLGNSRLFCNKTQLAASGIDCRKEICRCMNVIELPAFANIEFVISSATMSPHPIHLHGYSFRVVGMGVLGEDRIENIEQIDKQNPLPRRIRDGPLKDSVQVPGFGYTIVRFFTDNPGYWIMHCHISTHSENGMSAVIRVGAAQQMRMCPVSNCGLCSSVF